MWALCTGVFRALWVMESRAKAARVGGEKGLRPGDRQEVVLAHREGSKRTLAAHRLATSACTSGPRTQSQVVLLGLGYRSTTVHTLPKEAQTGLLFIHRLYFTVRMPPPHDRDDTLSGDAWGGERVEAGSHGIDQIQAC